jgi:hypothetical protein
MSVCCASCLRADSSGLTLNVFSILLKQLDARIVVAAPTIGPAHPPPPHGRCRTRSDRLRAQDRVGALRMRPLPPLLQVLHHQRIRPTTGELGSPVNSNLSMTLASAADREK